MWDTLSIKLVVDPAINRLLKPIYHLLFYRQTFYHLVKAVIEKQYSQELMMVSRPEYTELAICLPRGVNPDRIVTYSFAG